jgi:hypothetical protein
MDLEVLVCLATMRPLLFFQDDLLQKKIGEVTVRD